MNKYTNFFKMLLLSVVGILLVSCQESDEPKAKQVDPEQTAILEQFVHGVVVPTYKSLADNTIELSGICQELMKNPSQELVDKACKKWVEARAYWERSEAILFGAAGDYNIDPHIDSWPLQKNQLDNILQNKTLLDELKEEGADAKGFTSLGYGLLGFHAVEYMIFRDSKPRKVAEITEPERIYNAAVAEDLARQATRLEASWAGVDKITAAKKKTLEDAELLPTMDYGEIMIAAGEQGNTTYKSQKDAFVQILQGASDITDEVGNTKITDPVNSGNVLDVESWYSWNSIEDFTDHLRSVRNAYYGSLDGTAHKHSMASYMAQHHPELDKEIRSAIDNAIKTVAAMPAPFRNNLTKEATKPAIEACNALLEKIDAAIEAVQK